VEFAAAGPRRGRPGLLFFSEYQRMLQYTTGATVDMFPCSFSSCTSINFASSRVSRFSALLFPVHCAV